MRRQLALAVVLAVVGVVWILQGIGALGGSVMTGSTFWAAAGVVTLGVGAILGWRARNRGGGVGSGRS